MKRNINSINENVELLTKLKSNEEGNEKTNNNTITLTMFTSSSDS